MLPNLPLAKSNFAKSSSSTILILSKYLINVSVLATFNYSTHLLFDYNKIY